MDKQEFLIQLRKRLWQLPDAEIEERLTFYSEMIDDRMEEGLSEADAVFEIGSIDALAAQILADAPAATLVKAQTNKRRTAKAWMIVLLVLGSPLWLSLLIAAFSVVLSVYVVLWSVIISLWSVFASLAVCALGCIVAGIGFVCVRQLPTALITIGAGLICAGVSIFLFFGCTGATKGILWLSKKLFLWIKSWFCKKEEA